MSEDDLAREAKARLDAVADDPEGRYRLCARFYARFGHGVAGGAGFGESELAFVRWEIERGVLAPLDAQRPGSRWWREVNASLLYDAALAALAYDAAPDIDVSPDVRRWLDYIRVPSSRTWYLAHNGSVVSGYLRNVDAARAELGAEQRFMNIVLYRVLFAQALSTGSGALGLLGRVLADPVLPAVSILVDVREFYPRDYPLTERDLRNMLGRGDGILDLAVRLFDDGLILPEATAIYTSAAAELNIPGLAKLIQNGQPRYPPP